MTENNARIFVVPFNEKVLALAGDRRLAVRAGAPGEIGRIAETVSPGRLHSIEAEAESLAGLEIKKEWRNLPLVFRLKKAGRLLDALPALDSLRDCAARFYFPATAENISAARALSSLLVKTGLVLTEPGTDWGALEDLLAYDSCGKMPHASVEPFLYAYTEHKNPRADYNELYLEKEGTFFHCDADGNVALSRAALARGEFIGSLEKPAGLDLSGHSLAAREKGRAPLLKFEGCSVCRAWRVCGFRNSESGKPCAMKNFMSELAAAAEQVNKNADNNI
ncbi:MAG: hypothetical protein ACYC2I_11210 [Elusimicrobiales bacterium]